MESNFFMVSLHMTPKKKEQQSGTVVTQHYWPLFTLDIHNNTDTNFNLYFIVIEKIIIINYYYYYYYYY